MLAASLCAALALSSPAQTAYWDDVIDIEPWEYGATGGLLAWADEVDPTFHVAPVG